MAAMVYAGKIIKELGLNDQFTIYFTGTVMEEDCDGLCWQYLLKEEKLKPEFVVITEPTNLNIYRGHRGRMEIRVEVKGRSCHGSAPERGRQCHLQDRPHRAGDREAERAPAEGPVPGQGHRHGHRGALLLAVALRRRRWGRAFTWTAGSPPARPRPAPWPRCGTRPSGRAIPTPRSSCSITPRPPTPARCIRRRSITRPGCWRRSRPI